jgi:hypothetical protein
MAVAMTHNQKVFAEKILLETLEAFKHLSPVEVMGCLDLIKNDTSHNCVFEVDAKVRREYK